MATMSIEGIINVLKQYDARYTDDDALTMKEYCEARGLTPFREVFPLIFSDKEGKTTIAFKEHYAVQERWVFENGGAFEVSRKDSTFQTKKGTGYRCVVVLIPNKYMAQIPSMINGLLAMGVPEDRARAQVAQQLGKEGEGVVLPHEQSGYGMKPELKAYKRARELAERQLFGIAPSRPVAPLELTEQDHAEGAKALYGDVRIKHNGNGHAAPDQDAIRDRALLVDPGIVQPPEDDDAPKVDVLDPPARHRASWETNSPNEDSAYDVFKAAEVRAEAVGLVVPVLKEGLSAAMIKAAASLVSNRADAVDSGADLKDAQQVLEQRFQIYRA